MINRYLFIAYEGTDKETLVSFTPHTGKLGGTLRCVVY